MVSEEQDSQNGLNDSSDIRDESTKSLFDMFQSRKIKIRAVNFPKTGDISEPLNFSIPIITLRSIDADPEFQRCFYGHPVTLRKEKRDQAMFKKVISKFDGKNKQSRTERRSSSSCIDLSEESGTDDQNELIVNDDLDDPFLRSDDPEYEPVLPIVKSRRKLPMSTRARVMTKRRRLKVQELDFDSSSGSSCTIPQSGEKEMDVRRNCTQLKRKCPSKSQRKQGRKKRSESKTPDTTLPNGMRLRDRSMHRSTFGLYKDGSTDVETDTHSLSGPPELYMEVNISSVEEITVIDSLDGSEIITVPDGTADEDEISAPTSAEIPDAYNDIQNPPIQSASTLAETAVSVKSEKFSIISKSLKFDPVTSPTKKSHLKGFVDMKNTVIPHNQKPSILPIPVIPTASVLTDSVKNVHNKTKLKTKDKSCSKIPESSDEIFVPPVSKSADNQIINSTIEQDENTSVGSDSENEIFICIYCKRVFSNWIGLENHAWERTENAGIVICPEVLSPLDNAGSSITTTLEVIQASSSISDSLKRSQAYSPNAVREKTKFQNSDEIQPTEPNKIHSTKLCPYCNMNVRVASIDYHGITTHIEKGIEPYLFKCNICFSPFQVFSELLQHFEISHGHKLLSSSTAPQEFGGVSVSKVRLKPSAAVISASIHAGTSLSPVSNSESIHWGNSQGINMTGRITSKTSRSQGDKTCAWSSEIPSKTGGVNPSELKKELLDIIVQNSCKRPVPVRDYPANKRQNNCQDADDELKFEKILKHILRTQPIFDINTLTTEEIKQLEQDINKTAIKVYGDVHVGDKGKLRKFTDGINFVLRKTFLRREINIRESEVSSTCRTSSIECDSGLESHIEDENQRQVGIIVSQTQSDPVILDNAPDLYTNPNHQGSYIPVESNNLNAPVSYVCPYCGMHFESLKLLDTHAERHTIGMPNPHDLSQILKVFPCVQCGAKVANLKQYGEHVMLHAANDTTESVPPGTLGDTPPETPPMAAPQNIPIIDLTSGADTMAQGSCQPINNDAIVPVIRQGFGHHDISQLHSMITNLVCPCGRQFESSDTFMKHFSSVHGSVVCGICNLCFSTHEEGQEHVFRIHKRTDMRVQEIVPGSALESNRSWELKKILQQPAILRYVGPVSATSPDKGSVQQVSQLRATIRAKVTGPPRVRQMSKNLNAVQRPPSRSPVRYPPRHRANSIIRHPTVNMYPSNVPNHIPQIPHLQPYTNPQFNLPQTCSSTRNDNRTSQVEPMQNVVGVTVQHTTESSTLRNYITQPHQIFLQPIQPISTITPSTFPVSMASSITGFQQTQSIGVSTAVLQTTPLEDGRQNNQFTPNTAVISQYPPNVLLQCGECGCQFQSDFEIAEHFWGVHGAI